jgi:hypothetical protein
MIRFVPVGLLALASTALGQAANPVPFGWALAGSSPANYSVAVDHLDTGAGGASATLTSRGGVPGGDTSGGTLMQQIKADEYRGRHVRFTARIKTQAVDGSATLWLRVDGPGAVGVIDNMTSPKRYLQGDNDWVANSLVLNVPDGAVSISYGVGLRGSGKVWVNGVRLESVDQNIPVTTTLPPYTHTRPPETEHLLPSPTNLGFDL